MSVRRRRVFGILTLLSVTLLAVACGDSQDSPSALAAGSAVGLVFEVSPGVLVTAAGEDARLARIARKLALALGSSPGLREHIQSEISASPYREWKLDFRAQLADVSNGLLSGLAQAEGGNTRAIMASVDSLMPLELYIPLTPTAKSGRVTKSSSWRHSSAMIQALRFRPTI